MKPYDNIKLIVTCTSVGANKLIFYLELVERLSCSRYQYFSDVLLANFTALFPGSTMIH